ncbi:hypothetical protein ABZ016_01605 [Streptomyces sp. NPDC006372]|uniref:hypothetical protein n=1 Tax=Streptomyces sp. NPDC006372 TaxID=3155599 RepID=UPI0033B91E2F
MIKRRILTGTLATVAVAGLATPMASATTSSAPQTETQPKVKACELYSNNVVQTGNDLSGVGGRRGCAGDDSQTVTVTVYKWVNNGSDVKVGSATQSAANVELNARGACQGKGFYYTYTQDSAGGEKYSPRVEMC